MVLPTRSQRYSAAPRTGAHRIRESRSGRPLLKANTRVQAKKASTRSNMYQAVVAHWAELEGTWWGALSKSVILRGKGADLRSAARLATSWSGDRIDPLYQISMVAWQPYLFSPLSVTLDPTSSFPSCTEFFNLFTNKIGKFLENTQNIQHQTLWKRNHSVDVMLGCFRGTTPFRVSFVGWHKFALFICNLRTEDYFSQWHDNNRWPTPFVHMLATKAYYDLQ